MTVLYLGLDPSRYPVKGRLIHYPVIRIEPKDPSEPGIQSALALLREFTHLIFTSKNAVEIFFSFIPEVYQLKDKIFIAVGSVTAMYLKKRGFSSLQAKEETQEGVIQLLKNLPLKNSFIFFPCSSLTRPLLREFLLREQIKHFICPLYDTVHQKLEPVPNLVEIDEIVFTSPSTVDGFLKIFSTIPEKNKIICIGQITEKYLNKPSSLGIVGTSFQNMKT